MATFDPTVPADGDDLEAGPVRENFGALNEQNAATNARIDNIPQGPPGENGADGRSINPRGTWSDSETYNRCDLVAHEDMLYVCNQDNTTMATPGSDPRWQSADINVNVSQINSDLTVNGNIQNNGGLNTGGVGMGVSDAGGSGEAGIFHGADTSSGYLLPSLVIRGNGMTIFQMKFDYGGQLDGMGNPTIQNGSIWRWDSMALAMKPWNITLRTVQVLDENGNPVTIQVICPPA